MMDSTSTEAVETKEKGLISPYGGELVNLLVSAEQNPGT